MRVSQEGLVTFYCVRFTSRLFSVPCLPLPQGIMSSVWELLYLQTGNDLRVVVFLSRSISVCWSIQAVLLEDVMEYAWRKNESFWSYYIKDKTLRRLHHLSTYSSATLKDTSLWRTSTTYSFAILIFQEGMKERLIRPDQDRLPSNSRTCRVATTGGFLPSSDLDVV